MNISFSLTKAQILNRTKHVTRRLGWQKLRPGTILTAVEKGQGLKKGEHPVVLAKIRVRSVRREPLSKMITAEDGAYGVGEVYREGFPKMTPVEFVDMFCAHNKCRPTVVITRIEFDYA